MNYFKQVAEMLGVELEEEFKITNCPGYPGVYKFTSEGLLDSNNCSRLLGLLSLLLAGKLEIEKIPFKPKQGDKYYYIRPFGNVVWETWVGNTVDLHLHKYKLGNCFRTKEEITPEIIERYKAFLTNGEQIKW